MLNDPQKPLMCYDTPVVTNCIATTHNKIMTGKKTSESKPANYFNHEHRGKHVKLETDEFQC